MLYGKVQSCGCLKSKPQRDLQLYCAEIGFTPNVNDRTVISPYELDIHVVERAVAIEYCGLRWHGEYRNGSDARLRHARKLALCESLGIHLLTILLG